MKSDKVELSEEPDQLLGSPDVSGALRELAERVRSKIFAPGKQAESVDFVISGGYKLYGIALANLGELSDKERSERGLPRFRLVYIHERGNRLMTYGRCGFRVGGTQAKNPVRTVIRDFGGTGT